jgi:hypothetical protein
MGGEVACAEEQGIESHYLPSVTSHLHIIGCKVGLMHLKIRAHRILFDGYLFLFLFYDAQHSV